MIPAVADDLIAVLDDQLRLPDRALGAGRRRFVAARLDQLTDDLRFTGLF